MSNLTNEYKKIVEGVSEAEVVQDEVVEEVEELEDEVVEEQAVSEEESEDVAEAKKEAYHSDEEEDDDDDDDEVEESAPKFEMPKTKAGIVNAAVDMLKKARKHEAQELLGRMLKQSESIDDGSVGKAIDAQKKKDKDKSIKMKPSEADKNPEKIVKSPVESVDWSEDLDVIVAEEATLSDGFRDKASAIFEAAFQSKVGAEIDRLESEYAQNLESEVSEIQNDLVEKVDSYLNYVVENWMKENELAVQTGLRTEIAEEFMSSLQSVFKEHYIEVPEGKADLIDDLADQVAELEEQLNKTTEDNISLYEKAQSYEKADIVRKQSSGLAATEAEKLAGLVEDVEFEDSDTFENKVKTIKESYFKSDVSGSTDEADAVVATDDSPVEISETMSAYTNAITKFNK